MDISPKIDQLQTSCNIELDQTIVSTDDLLLLYGVDVLSSECVGKLTSNMYLM